MIHTCYKLSFLISLSLITLPGFGQDGKPRQGLAATEANETALQARDVVAAVDSDDVNGLKALIARHPGLLESSLTEDGANGDAPHLHTAISGSVQEKNTKKPTN
jgi:hypothetical protein